MYFEISTYGFAPHMVSVLGDLETTLGFSDSLEGLTESRKTAIFIVKFYYSERIQTKINTGRRCIG